ncbi:hypothetical protein AMJ49_02465 [Parcubacteria bacterium DG_74_2]|nr:MAG: hypothetical protein AMJ49_02465 [Parcubacteria bacterium DG_74_2]
MLNTKFKTQKGISIYLVILISTIILAIASGISTIIISQIKMTRQVGDSVVAFFVADTGIEAVLADPDGYNFGITYFGYLDLDGGGTEIDPTKTCSVGLMNYPEDSCYAIKKISPGVDNCPTDVTYCIDSSGYFKKTRRAIQISR